MLTGVAMTGSNAILVSRRAGISGSKAKIKNDKGRFYHRTLTPTLSLKGRGRDSDNCF